MKHTLRSLILTATVTAMTFTAVSATQEENWIEFKAKNNTLSIQLPDSYVVVDNENPQFKEGQKRVIDQNPKLAQMLKNTQTQNYALYVMDFSDDMSDGFMDNMNAIVNPAGGLTADLFPQVWDQVKNNIPWKDGKSNHKILKTKQGQTLRYWGTMIIEADGQKIEAGIHGNLFVKNEKLYVITFSCGGAELKDKQKTFEKAFETIKTN